VTSENFGTSLTVNGDKYIEKKNSKMFGIFCSLKTLFIFKPIQTPFPGLWFPTNCLHLIFIKKPDSLTDGGFCYFNN
jgi:hypothetical protein